MSLRELAAADSAVLLGDETPVILTAPDGTSYPVHGLVYAVGVSVDANGLPVAADRRDVTLSTLELAVAGIPDPYVLKSPSWLIATTDVQGRALTGRLDTVRVDATLGRVTVTVKRS
jgi:hypothetical protein